MERIKSFYRTVFFKRREAYKKTFDITNPNAALVLSDLRKFCRGTGSKYMGDVHKTHVMLGRNEVWERIQTYLNIPDSDISKLVETYDE